MTEIHKLGLTPDVEVELDDDVKKMVTIPLEKDKQLQEAIRQLGFTPDPTIWDK